MIQFTARISISISILFFLLNSNSNCLPFIDFLNSHNNNNHQLNNLNFLPHENDNSNINGLNSNSNNNDENLDNNKNDTNNDEELDLSVFGNTDESFFDFANRRVAEIKNLNQNLIDKSINSCPYAPKSFLKQPLNDDESMIRSARSSNNQDKHNCVVGSFSFENFYGLTSDRLFLLDPFTIGLISSTDSTLRLYNFNLFHKTLTHIRTKYFRNEVPYDACADKSKNIYIVFPDQNKIAKYFLNQSNPSVRNFNGLKNNKSQSIIKEIQMIKDSDFRPTAIACHDEHIYVSEKPKNVVRIYDKFLKLVRVIYLNGIIVSNHHGLAVNQNVRVLIDGSDSLALFNPNIASSNFNTKKYSLSAERNRVNVCHFYKNMNCIEDVHVAIDSKTKSYIYAADSCNNEILQFLYNKDEKIALNQRFEINGRPISVITNQLGYIFVLSDLPRKIYILDPRECMNYKS